MIIKDPIKLLINKISILSFCFLCFQLNAQYSDDETDLTSAIMSHQNAEASQLVPQEKFNKRAKIRAIELSPNGQSLAYLSTENNGLKLTVMNTHNGLIISSFQSNLLKAIDWSSDGNLLFLHTSEHIGYLNINKPSSKPIVFYRYNKNYKESFYRLHPSDNQQVIIKRKVNNSNESQPHQLVSIDLQGHQTVLFKDKIEIFDDLFDSKGNLIFIRQPVKDQHTIYQLTAKGKQPVFHCIVIDKCRMVKFDAEHQNLYLMGYDNYNLRSLFTFNLPTGRKELLHQHDSADLQTVILDESTQQIIQLKYLSDRMQNIGLDERWDSHYKWIESQLQGSIYINPTHLGSLWLVKQTAGNLHHPKYHLYDSNTQQLQAIVEELRNSGEPILESQLNHTIPIKYLASDGLLLHGYVTLPKGKKLNQVPLLAQIHGGPFGRVNGVYSRWQTLVNQGYAVFQPNFRASTSYGLDYMLAGKGQYSTRVQQDIVEGIQFLLNQGIGNPDQIGVFGHSFGGYSVLALLANYPDFFVAGIATAPGTDLLDLLLAMDDKDLNDYDGIPLKATIPILFADMKNEELLKTIKSQSPRATWKNVSKPLLIWAGALDQRIPVTHLRDYALKLKQAGKPITYIEDANTGHNFSFYDRIGHKAFTFMINDFFAQHFDKPRPQTDFEIDDYFTKYTVY
jgi:protease II